MGYSKLAYEEFIEHPEVWGTVLPNLATELFSKGYDGVSAIDFYDDIFGDDLQEERLPGDYITGEYGGFAVEKIPLLDEDGNPVLDSKGHQKYKGRKYRVTKENFELYDLIDRSENFCMIAPISYAGNSRANENTRFMYALCIEIDDLIPRSGINELIYSWERKTNPTPKPTYIVCSGEGLHLYYVFEKPIPLWKNIFEQLVEVKKHLTPRLWNQFVSKTPIEWESINQPFRCVGSRTKNGSYAMAFKIGEKITIEYLNQFLPNEIKMDCIYKSKCSLKDAKKLYPEWYKRRIEEKKERGHWERYEPIYYNWIEKILNGAEVGKRYNCLENLCSLAVQCNIAPEQVEKDCCRVAEYFETLTIEEDNHFTEYDIICALRTYHKAGEQAYRRRIGFISRKTGIALTPNKRNGRTQKQHCEVMRAIQSVTNPNWRGGNGRPKGSSKEKDIVVEWRKNNPNGKKADCIRDTGLSKPTVYKWW